MNLRYWIRCFRAYIIILIISISGYWFARTIILNFDNRIDEEIRYYDNILDNHLYPPPWFISKWTIADYLIRKEKLKILDDQYAIEQNEKVFIRINDRNLIEKRRHNYTILEYTKVLSRPKFCTKTDEFIFGKQCPYRNCRYTCNRNLSLIADVLLMHRSDIDYDQLPKERNFDQIWLFWHDEPCGVQQEAIPIQFNWTISYRLNSEAHIGAYGLTILREKILSNKEWNSYIDEQFHYRKAYAIWFVSNCQPKARLEYYRQLQIYYPLTKVYGNCVEQNRTHSCSRQSQCESLELSKNKFYLAFESQSCRNYITEKFWRSLSFGIIPIVFGPREKLSLERIAPPNSFIFTGDFQTVQELAEHLNEINQNQTLFGQYHRWRRFYQVLYQPQDVEHYRFCELCYRLNTNTNKIYYRDINKFFLEDC